MKQKANARQKREAEALRRKGAFATQKAEKPAEAPAPAATAPTTPKRRTAPAAENVPAKTPEEETREFLEYLDRHGVPADKDETARRTARPGKPCGAGGAIPRLNLEEGMPTSAEALSRLRTGLQEMRVSREKAVKLIHGYGSTGRGGAIRAAVRQELAAMKRNRQIADYIPGEDFSPLDAASRQLAEEYRSAVRDPDYGRMNHGITIAVLRKG